MPEEKTSPSAPNEDLRQIRTNILSSFKSGKEISKGDRESYEEIHFSENKFHAKSGYHLEDPEVDLTFSSDEEFLNWLFKRYSYPNDTEIQVWNRIQEELGRF